MKKTRIIAMAMALAIALMGASYAYWTDQVVVSGTVSTGTMDWDMTKINEGFYTLEGMKRTDANAADYGVQIKDNGNLDENLVKVEVNNLSPGMGFFKTYIVEKKTTIPFEVATLDFDFGVENVSDAELLKMTNFIENTSIFIHIDGDGVGIPISNYLKLKDSDKKELVQRINKILTDENKTKIAVEIGLSMNEKVTSTDAMNKAITMMFKAEFKQLNAK